MILFTADWHIKYGQKNVPVDWQENRYLQMAERICKIIQDRGITHTIIGGDLFDIPDPGIKEVCTAIHIIKRISSFVDEVHIYSGNHELLRDNTTSLKYLNGILDKVVIHTKPTTILDTVDIIPYEYIKKFNPSEYSGSILCTHVRGDIPPHVKAEIDLDKLNRWDLVLAGDLHAYSNSQRGFIFYPGSPVTTSFHRTKSVGENGILIVNHRTQEVEFVDLELPQLLRFTVSANEVPDKQDTKDHIVYEVTGSILELANVKIDDRVEKKISSVTSEATLPILNLQLDEQVRLFIKEILNLSDKEVEEVMKLYYDNHRINDVV